MRLYLRASALGALLACAAAGAQTGPPAVPQPSTPFAVAPAFPQFAEGWQGRPSTRPAVAPRAHLVAERSGVLTVDRSKRLRLDIDFGSVVIRTDSPDEVRYHVHLEADGNDSAAQAMLDAYRVRAVSQPHTIVITAHTPQQNSPDNFWVTYEVSVPRNLPVVVSTGIGNIQMQDSSAAVQLDTGGGNITVGNVLEANLDTKGGHIVVGNVAGNLHANTGGGHITASNIGGDAVLTTTGGHIHAGRIGGTATLETGGGNISVDRASSSVTATSAAGQISFGEAAGAINAHTSGGGIRVLRVAGPMQLQSQGGSILLTQVENEVHASTGTGSITAWFAPGEKLLNASDLAANEGDIQIYLPRSLAMTIDATVESPDHRIVADPALPLKLNYVTTPSGKQLHGECKLNGGGEVLHLRTDLGNIHLLYADSVLNQQMLVREQELRLQIAQAQEQMDQIMKFAQSSDTAQLKEIANEIAQQEMQMARDVAAQHAPMAIPVPQQPGAPDSAPNMIFIPPQAAMPAPMANSPVVPLQNVTPSAPVLAPVPPDQQPAMTELWWMKLGELWYGGVKQEGADEQKRCIYGPRPEYPSAAQQAGIEGPVELHVLIDKDGHVQEVWGVSGEQVLVNAAIGAVKKWRYRPMMLDGKPVPVVTTVRLEFRIM
jgi:TonB family protein